MRTSDRAKLFVSGEIILARTAKGQNFLLSLEQKILAFELSAHEEQISYPTPSLTKEIEAINACTLDNYN
jgi:hypothetical protein